MSTVSVRDLRNHSADVLARVARGESLTVTKDGDPVAQMIPLARPALGARQLVERRRSLPRVDAVQWRADVDEALDSSL